jgi:hypothetical protein
LIFIWGNKVIYKVKLFETGEVVEIDDSRAARDRDGNSISKYYVDWHGYVAENRLNERGFVESVDIGILEEG